MVKVLITIAGGERVGGAENRLMTTLRHLDRSRIEPVVVFLETGSFPTEVAHMGVPVEVVSTPPLRRGLSLSAMWTVYRVIQREQPDVLLNWGHRPHAYVAPAAIAAGMKDQLVWWQLGVPGPHLAHRLSALLPARAVACSSHFIANLQGLYWPRRPTFVVYPGVDIPTRPSRDELSDLRESLGIPPGPPVVGIVGRLEPRKGHGALLRALAELRGRGHRIHGLIVGGRDSRAPKYELELRSLTDKLGLSGLVTFTGSVSDPGPYYHLMDVFVCSSPREPFGIVVIEALAAGLPVVAVDNAGPGEIIEHEESGLLVATAAPDLFADAVERLIVDEELRQRLAEGGRRRHEEQFTAERMTRTLETKLEEIAAARD